MPIAGDAVPAFAHDSRARLGMLLAGSAREGDREAVVPFRPRN